MRKKFNEQEAADAYELHMHTYNYQIHWRAKSWEALYAYYDYMEDADDRMVVIECLRP